MSNPTDVGAKNNQGGVSPGQMALSQYTFGENAVKNASDFGRTGMGMSTGLTQADAGAYMNQARQLQQFSQADASAMNAFNQQQKNQTASGIGGLGSLLGGI